MSGQHSFSKVAEQIVTFNNNLVETLSKLNQLVNSTEQSLVINITDQSGIIRQFSLPSIGFLKSEIDRLNNNINAMYNIDGGGALIQPASSNKFKKVVTVDLNKEPNDISSLGNVTTFVSSKNWFFEEMMNPMISVEFDLSNIVENNVRKVLSRRYIVDFQKNSAGNRTAAGESALTSFNTRWKGNNAINVADFENWLKTTPGVNNTSLTDYDEEMFDLEPNTVRMSGVFSVLGTEEDFNSRKLWYVLNSLDYIDTTNGMMNLLSVDD
jgi:hypothetical protein